jgi:hypothetical protein
VMLISVLKLLADYRYVPNPYMDSSRFESILLHQN